MAFVLDASIAACWCFADERSTVADAAMDLLLEGEAVVPPLWTIEIRNILIVNERRGRIEPDDSNIFLRDLTRLPIRVRHGADEQALVLLARKHGLTAYDAAYLELAVRTGVAVATLDRLLADAVRTEGLELVGT